MKFFESEDNRINDSFLSNITNFKRPSNIVIGLLLCIIMALVVQTNNLRLQISDLNKTVMV